MNPPAIPERISSLLPKARKERLDNLLKRKVSSLSQVSMSNTVSKFIEAKTDALESEYEHGDAQRTFYKDALHDKLLTIEQYQDISKNFPSQHHLEQVQVEIKLLKKQRKIIQDDLEEIQPEKPQLEAAYISLITTRVEAACGKAPKVGTKLDRTKFRKDVLKHYAGERHNETTDQVEHYCALTGWYGASGAKGTSPVRAAHIVPRSLTGDDLEYLFGVSSGGAAIVSAPNNGLLLHTNIETAMDECRVVIYPEKQGDTTEWKLFVTDAKMLPQLATETMHWKDLHGKSLQFLNDKRPAKRFLYFRLIMTYLIQKRRDVESVAWASQIPSKGHIWATPGPYLRKTLLLSLARRVSDRYLPEAFYEHHTFSDLPYAKNRPDDEADFTTSLANKVISYGEGPESDSESDSESD